jgi:hypothetical protein
MDEAGESKRDQAAKMLGRILAMPYRSTQLATLVGLIIDAAKEEIRAEMAEQAEERRWQEMERTISLETPHSPMFWEEYRALKAKREAAGKSTD